MKLFRTMRAYLWRSLKCFWGSHDWSHHPHSSMCRVCWKIKERRLKRKDPYENLYSGCDVGE